MPRQTHRARSLLARAALGVLYANKDGDGAGGAGDVKPPVVPPVVKPADDADKVTLTKAELQAQIDAAAKAASKAESDRLTKERDAEKTAREEADAKQRGEFEKLYQKEVKDREAKEIEAAGLKLDLRKTQVQGRLRDFIAENHRDYSAAAKYIAPLLTIDADTSDEDADKQIKSAVEQYVKDNPRARVIGPPPSPSSKMPAGVDAPPPQQQQHRVNSPASRF